MTAPRHCLSGQLPTPVALYYVALVVRSVLTGPYRVCKRVHLVLLVLPCGDRAMLSSAWENLFVRNIGRIPILVHQLPSPWHELLGYF